MIPVCKPCWGLNEEAVVVRVMRSGRLIQGPEVEAFEADVARWVGVRHAIAVSSGTTALHTALMAMGVKAGDDVLVPAFTFVATANAVLACGAKPVPCDISLGTFNIDADKLPSNPQFLVTVHAFGVVSQIRSGIVLEDAACALGSFKGLRGRAATFSFHATKTITTGEGGMVITDDDELAARCRTLRDQKHGQGMAYNYRMTEMAGAIGRVQMTKLDWIVGERRDIAAVYDAEFAGTIQARIPPSGGNYQSYVLLLNEHGPYREDVIAKLAERGVEALPGTQFLGGMPHLRAPGLPNAYLAGVKAMRIPIWPDMTEPEVDQVIEAVKEVLA